MLFVMRWGHHRVLLPFVYVYSRQYFCGKHRYEESICYLLNENIPHRHHHKKNLGIDHFRDSFTWIYFKSCIYKAILILFILRGNSYRFFTDLNSHMKFMDYGFDSIVVCHVIPLICHKFAHSILRNLQIYYGKQVIVLL